MCWTCTRAKKHSFRLLREENHLMMLKTKTKQRQAIQLHVGSVVKAINISRECKISLKFVFDETGVFHSNASVQHFGWWAISMDLNNVINCFAWSSLKSIQLITKAAFVFVWIDVFRIISWVFGISACWLTHRITTRMPNELGVFLSVQMYLPKPKTVEIFFCFHTINFRFQSHVFATFQSSAEMMYVSRCWRFVIGADLSTINVQRTKALNNNTWKKSYYFN